MPFRFRKSIKIAKGLKINLSKSGVSTTIGGRGASVNISKRGTRTTFGLPGTGLSYSSTSATPGKPAAKGSPPRSGNTSNNGSGCLAGFWSFLLLPFRVMIDLFNSVRDPHTRRSTLILVGVLMGTCFACFGTATLVEGTGLLRTPAPTVDVDAIATNAMIKAWLPYTQTAAAVIPDTGAAETSIPSPTITIADTPTITKTPTITNTSTVTFTAIATNTPRPTFTLRPQNTPTIASSSGGGGGTGNCDPSYPGVCIPPRPPDLDCPQIPYTNFTVLPPDPHGFDRDGDGVGCDG